MRSKKHIERDVEIHVEQLNNVQFVPSCMVGAQTCIQEERRLGVHHIFVRL
jgi:hypothetical protein